MRLFRSVLFFNLIDFIFKLLYQLRRFLNYAFNDSSRYFHSYLLQLLFYLHSLLGRWITLFNQV